MMMAGIEHQAMISFNNISDSVNYNAAFEHKDDNVKIQQMSQASSEHT